ncbi:hypothetical protein LSAT2_008854 [Lamellibrachia satsuma]|nr:hypothetical protein LSAT2_008854 [Lamellibrachia satsuma]
MQALRYFSRGLATSAKLGKAASALPDHNRVPVSRCSQAAVAATRHQQTVVSPTRRPSGWLNTRRLVDSTTSHVKYNEPIPANDLPRTAGICSMYRLPVVPDTTGLDVCFIGVPLDQGTSNRSGTRFGPRQIRSESPQVRRFNQDTVDLMSSRRETSVSRRGGVVAPARVAQSLGDYVLFWRDNIIMNMKIPALAAR